MNDDDQLSSPMDDLVALSTQTLQPCPCGWSRRRGAEKAHSRGAAGEGEGRKEGELEDEQGNVEEVEEDEEELRCDAVLDSIDRLEKHIRAHINATPLFKRKSPCRWKSCALAFAKAEDLFGHITSSHFPSSVRYCPFKSCVIGPGERRLTSFYLPQHLESKHGVPASLETHPTLSPSVIDNLLPPARPLADIALSLLPPIPSDKKLRDLDRLVIPHFLHHARVVSSATAEEVAALPPPSGRAVLSGRARRDWMGQFGLKGELSESEDDGADDFEDEDEVPLIMPAFRRNADRLSTVVLSTGTSTLGKRSRKIGERRAFSHAHRNRPNLAPISSGSEFPGASSAAIIPPPPSSSHPRAAILPFATHLRPRRPLPGLSKPPAPSTPSGISSPLSITSPALAPSFASLSRRPRSARSPAPDATPLPPTSFRAMVPWFERQHGKTVEGEQAEDVIAEAEERVKKRTTAKKSTGTRPPVMPSGSARVSRESLTLSNHVPLVLTSCPLLE